MKPPAVFLDRDGTINYDPGYLSSPEDLRLLPRVQNGLSLLSRNKFLLFVVTNQSGIGRGYFTPEQLEEVNNKLIEKLAEDGIIFTEFACCPHRPEDNCSCRKPSPRMVLDLARNYSLDLSRSYFIGDKITDIQAGKNAGCRTVLIASPEKKKLLRGDRSWTAPDYTAPDIYRAAEWIVRQK